ncbi:MAG: BON domain-containing protein [Pseudomonadota bacterium]
MNVVPRILPLFLLLWLAGCASWIAPLSEQQLDTFHGTRTMGARIEDQRIERVAWINVTRSMPTLRDNGRLVVVSWNGQVLLAGQVPGDNERQQVEKTVAAVRHVLHVHNELTVGEPVGFWARSSDASITARVKMRLLFGPDVPGRRVKVLTENGVVYLMGLLTREETEMAVNAARNVYGVQKIVKIVEYIDARNATR